MPFNLLPILVVGGAVLLLKKKKKRAPIKNGNGKALPPATGRGIIFEGDTDNRPSGIRANVGELFSVTFTSSTASAPGAWKLNASPADNSVTHVRTEHDEVQSEALGGSTGKDVYVFKGAKPGKGSLVFHWQQPWLEGKEPPAQIVEILTEIS